MDKNIKRKKEYTITLDVAVFAENKKEAIEILEQHLIDGNYHYWLGDTVEEKNEMS